MKDPGTEASKESENQMKETTLSKITASVRVAKGMAERVLAASPNPQWTEYELQTIDEWIARQDVKLDRPEPSAAWSPRAEGQDEMSKHSAATLVWTREEDDQLRAAAVIRREYRRDLEAFVSQRKSDLAPGSKDRD